jgi:hypothetical protein
MMSLIYFQVERNIRHMKDGWMTFDVDEHVWVILDYGVMKTHHEQVVMCYTAVDQNRLSEIDV